MRRTPLTSLSAAVPGRSANAVEAIVAPIQRLASADRLRIVRPSALRRRNTRCRGPANIPPILVPSSARSMNAATTPWPATGATMLIACVPVRVSVIGPVVPALGWASHAAPEYPSVGEVGGLDEHATAPSLRTT